MSKSLLKYSDYLYLADPSIKQLKLAKEKLKNEVNVKYIQLMEEGKIPLDSNTIDLLVMIRVSHHLIEPGPTFKEINRILKTNGLAIIEIANHAHIINRLKYYVHFRKLPLKPVRIGRAANGISDDIPFVNHNPHTIESSFKQNNMHIVKVLSVSNLRNRSIKKILGLNLTLIFEKRFQGILAKILFGPSIFYLVRKTGNS